MIGDIEIGDAQEVTMPDDDSDETWHVHPDAPWTDPQWGTGVICDYCQPAAKVHGGGKKVHFNLSRLRNQNEAGVTGPGMEREIIESARADGRLDKIDRLR